MCISNELGLEETSQHVTGWTWEHEDLDQLCPKVSGNTEDMYKTEGITPWLLDDHDYPAIPYETMAKFMDYSPRSSGGSNVLSVNPNSHRNLHHVYLQDPS